MNSIFFGLSETDLIRKNNSMNINELYVRLLERYLTETRKLKSGYPYAPFIPHVFPNYGKADTKIFYFGRDTYYWLNSTELTINNIEGYLEKNSQVVDPVKQVPLYKNNSNSFWTFVAQLHLFIRTGKLKTDFCQFTEKETCFLNEIGYGNLHAVELQQSLENEGIWGEINPIEYKKLIQKSEFLNRMKYVLDIWKPDFIFILSWENYLEIFNGLEYENRAEWYEDNLRAVYTIKGYKTKIIWTSHPRRFAFLGMNTHSMIEYLSKTMYNLNK